MESEKSKKALAVQFFSEHDMSSSSFLYLRTAIENAVNIYLKDSKDEILKFTVTKNWNDEKPANLSEEGAVERTKKYNAKMPNPNYTFERLVLPDATKDRIYSTLCVFQHRDLIFNQWNLKTIASPMVALSFEGAPGTGKTMAAHAIANFLNKKIILASYAEIESMYHGEGPKNVQAVFEAAMNQDAVLFVDDAESLLSKRLSNVTTGSENAINSMRDQFLICLEQFKGLVIFASNKAESYDPALETRLWTIHFELPNEEQRCAIWKQHLPNSFPTTARPEELAKFSGICGREIRSAVVEIAASMVYMSNGIEKNIKPATIGDFNNKLNDIVKRRKAQVINTTKDGSGQEISDKTKKFLAENVSKVTAQETIKKSFS